MRRGFTLTELVVVLLVVAALAGVLVPTLGGFGERSKEQATAASLVRIRTAILGDESGSGYVGDVDYLRPGIPAARDLRLVDLFARPVWAPSYDPATRRGWSGPYLQHVAGLYSIDTTRGFTAAYGVDETVQGDQNGDSDAVDRDPCVLDGWGNPIVVQRPTVPPTPGDDEVLDLNLRLVSAGPDGVLDSDPSALDPVTLESSRGDDLVLFVFVAGV